MEERPHDHLLPAPAEVIELRRWRATLVQLAYAVIASGVWGMAKSVLLTTMMPHDLRAAVVAFLGDDLFSSILFLNNVFSLANLGLSFLVGRSARAEGLGRHVGPLYLAFAGLLVLEFVSYLILDVIDLFPLEALAVDELLGVLVDGSLAVMLAALIVTAIRVRRRTRQMGEA